MPGHDQTDDFRRRRRASTWLLLALCVATSAMPRAEVQGQTTGLATWKGIESASIHLAADRIQTWDDQGDQWFLLEGRSEVVQGDVSLNARDIVAHVVRSGRAAGPIHRVDLYAEGEVRDPAQPDATYPTIRTKLATTQGLTTAPSVRLRKRPRGLPILTRAFPRREGPDPSDETNPPDEPAPAPEPADAPGAVVPTASTQAPDQEPVPAPAEVAANAGPLPLVPSPPGAQVDPAVQPAQAVGSGPGFADDFSAPPLADPVQVPDPLPGEVPALPPVVDPVPFGPGADPLLIDPPTTLLPLPDGRPQTVAPIAGPPLAGEGGDIIALPGSQRIIEIQPRGQTDIEIGERLSDGTQPITIRNGVNIITRTAEQGIIDLEADNIIIWIKGKNDDAPVKVDFNNRIVTKSNQRIEFYLEGNVVLRQDEQRIQGKADQRTYTARSIYYDLQNEKILAQDAELELFAPGLITPIKHRSGRISQFHPIVTGPDGQPAQSTLSTIQADRTVTTGSRFADPGYSFTSRMIEITQVVDSQARPNESGLPYEKNDLTWQIDARQNFFYFGRIPVFYWPRFFVEADDLDPPLQGLSFATNNYFGQQIRADFDLFNIFGIRHVPEIDVWNFDLDYLSGRDKSLGQGIALGTELGWFGSDLIRDIQDPFHRKKGVAPSLFGNYAGYFDAYGLFDGARDVLGLGPAVITNGTNNNAAGRANFQRLSNPTYQDFRGRITARHMQSFTTKDTPLDEDFRVNAEVGAVLRNDRNFLEQYFKRLFDTGLDQENLLYAIRQKRNQTLTLQAEVNLQSFNTESQWLPKLDYYRLGDSLLGDRLTHFQHTGADYANVHTAAEVNNRTLFSFLPTDPISNTNRRFESGRIFTTHELDLPINLQFIRVTPYLQGQAIGWNNQINDHAVGRLWGAVGARADVTFWKVYPEAESELFNIHGLNHKIDFVADFRDAYSSTDLNSIGVQDDLDDNSQEYTRRYFALVNYGGAILPKQYDPRFLMLRRAISPITGTTDVQASVETLKLGIHQRLQTKRGQEGRRHINDYMVFDLDTTYFPNATRDNFNKPFGQNFYNYEWYLGDRTSFVSYGWFEFFKIAGVPTTVNNNNLRNDPFGLHIVTSGISITRIPKGNAFIGYTIVNTGPISTSALNTSYSYWLSPKWFGTAGSSYDFGNDILLAATGSLTRIGADYLTSVGLTVSPLQRSYQFVFEISPRLSPNLRAGSASGLSRLDSRFAPVE